MSQDEGRTKRVSGEKLVQAFADLFDAVELETTEEIDATLREAGYDPDEVALRMADIAEEMMDGRLAAGRVRRRVRFLISFELLQDLLMLPEEAEIVGVFASVLDTVSGHFEIYVDHPDFAPVVEGGTIPLVSPTYKTRYVTEFVSW